MPYVLRDANGEITAVFAEPTEGVREGLPLGHPELIAFMSRGTVPDEPRQSLFVSDFDMARITEDLIQTLIERGVINFTDLPERAREKLQGRRLLRGQLGNALSGIIDDGERL